MSVKNKLKKTAAILLSAAMMLTNAAVLAENEKTLRISDPVFYQLTEDGTQIKTEYRLTTNEKNSMYRFRTELQELRPGKIRICADASNQKDTEENAKLIATVWDKTTGKPISFEVSENGVIPPKSTQRLSADITVPEGGDYRLDAYIWNSLTGLKPLKEKTVLAQGPARLAFAFVEPYDRSNPAINLTWEATPEAVSYDICVEDAVWANTQELSHTLNLTPYTPYKIHVIGKRADGTLTAPSNAVYLMTEDTVESQQNRMAQWEDDRFGMMITWGGYAAFGGVFQGENVHGQTVDYHSKGSGNGSYAEWIKFGAGIPDDTYRAYVDENFTAANYDPKEWVRIAKEAGMKYIILISKHHEGMTLFHTDAKNGWSAEDTAAKAKIDSLPEKDMVRQLIKEAADAGIRIGMYYSQAIDWAQPGSVGWNPQRVANFSEADQQALRKDLEAAGFDKDTIDSNMSSLSGNGTYDQVATMTEEVIIPQVEELLTMRVMGADGQEHGIDTLWWDMGQKYYPELNYKIMKKVAELDPEKKIMNNNRIHHEGQYTTMPFDFVTPEQSIPSAPEYPYWETCMTMNENWGYSSEDKNFKPASELIQKLVHIASMGGNFLLNVGPKADGVFPEESVNLLNQVGEWMDANGASVYGTEGNPFPKDFSWGTATKKGEKLYLHVSDWSGSGSLLVPGLLTTPLSAEMITGVGQTAPLEIETAPEYSGIRLKGSSLSGEAPYAADTVITLTFESPELTISSDVITVPVVQNASTGKMTIKPSQARIITTDPPYENGLIVENGGANFGRWNHTEEYPEWQLQVTKPGIYTVRLNNTSPYDGTLSLVLKKDGAVVGTAEGPFVNTGTWVDYEERTYGMFQIPEPGNYALELHRAGAGPVNVQSILWEPAAGYSWNQISQNADLMKLGAKDALRSSAANAIGEDAVYGLDAAGGTMLWKLQLNDMKNFAAALKGASMDQAADITVNVLDETLANTLASASVSLKTDTWNAQDVALEPVLDLSAAVPGTYYLQLKAENGSKINLEYITLRDSGKLAIDTGCITLTPENPSKTVNLSLPGTAETGDPAVAQVTRVSDTQYTVEKAADAIQEAVTELVVKTSDGAQELRIPVTVLEGELNTPVTQPLPETPAAYTQIVSKGGGVLDQELLQAVKEQGMGVYRFRVDYRIPFTTYSNNSSLDYRDYPDMNYAVGLNGETWIGGMLPKNQEWTRAEVYIELQWKEELSSVVFRPVDNLNSFTGGKPLQIGSFSLQKVGGAEAVQNGSFANGSTEPWILSSGTALGVMGEAAPLFVQNPVDQSLQLRVYDAAVHNVATEGKSNDIFLEYEGEVGKTGNWWDANDTISWDIHMEEPGNYLMKYTGANAWDGEMVVTVTGLEGQGENTVSVFLPNNNGGWPVSTEKEIGMLPLKAGNYKVTVSHGYDGSAAFALMRLDLEPAAGTGWAKNAQAGNGAFILEAKTSKVFGVRAKNANWVIADWDNEKDTAAWKIELTQPKQLQVKLKGGNNGQVNNIYFTLYNEAGELLLQTEPLDVPAMAGWNDQFTESLGILDLSGVASGTCYLQIHQTANKGLNVQQLILE